MQIEQIGQNGHGKQPIHHGPAGAAFAPLDRRILLISLGAMLASLVGALLLARSVSRPVRELAAAAQRAAEAELAVNEVGLAW